MQDVATADVIARWPDGLGVLPHRLRLMCRIRPEQAGPKRAGFDDQGPNPKRRNLIVKGLRDSPRGANFVAQYAPKPGAVI